MFFLYIPIMIVAGFPNFDYKMPESLPLYKASQAMHRSN